MQVGKKEVSKLDIFTVSGVDTLFIHYYIMLFLIFKFYQLFILHCPVLVTGLNW